MLQDAPHFVALDWNGTIVPFFGMPPFPGVAAALERLREAGIPLVVVSHATQAQIDAEVARTGVRFTAVYGCEDKAPILSDLRLQYGGGVFLGDHPADGRAAEEAGVVFVQAALGGQPRFPQAASRFEDWEEVATLLLVPSTDLG